MKLLMITRKIDRDDWLAGHGYEWARALWNQLPPGSGLSVLCLEKGNCNGLDGVEVYSLGKERGNSRMDRFFNFLYLAGRETFKCDSIFCHQNPEYAIAVSPFAFLFRKKIVSWYVHKSVTWKTRLMLKVSSQVLTASPESFRIDSRKVRIVGHGIDTKVFSPRPRSEQSPVFRIITVGRISPVKKLDVMLEAVRDLVKSGQSAFCLDIIGAPGIPEQEKHMEQLKSFVTSNGLESYIKFLPPVAHYQVQEAYRHADLFLNLSQTGSVDKAILEAMACGIPVITSNEAFRDMLSPFVDFTWLPQTSPAALAEKIRLVSLLKLSDRLALGANLRRIVEESHSLSRLARTIISSFQ